MKKYAILFINLLTVIIFTGAGCATNNSPAVNNPSAQNKNETKPQTVELPENKFDAAIPVPGTNLVFAYPAKGFYQLGARVTSYEPGDPAGYGNVLTVQPEQPYATEKGSEFITVVVALRIAGPQEKMLADVVAGLNPKSFEAEYVKENGNYRTIGGKEFFIYNVTEDVNMWKAFSLQNNNVIITTLMYKPTDGAESQAAHQNNGKLFLEILEHISYKK